MSKLTSLPLRLLNLVGAGVCIALIFSSIGDNASAQGRERIQFRSETDDALKMSVFQEIPEFRSYLYDLDQEIGLIDKRGEWTPMVDADIWVFLLKNRTDALMLPKIVLDLLEDHYDGSPAFAIAASVSIDDVSRERMMYFVFLDDFGDHEFDVIGCDVATLLYSQLGGSEIANLQATQSNCYID